MRRSGLMILISIATITVSLIIFGIFMLLSANMNNLANFISAKLEIRVYLKDGLTEAEEKDFASKVGQIQGIVQSKLISKDEAWVKFKQNFRSVNLSDLMEKNPLPDTLQIKLKDNQKLSYMGAYLKTFSYYVEDVSYGGIIAQRIDLFSKFIRIAGGVLVVLLGSATLLIVVNTIRLTVMARQDEISIMQLVGATHAFIRWPFIIEGMIIGSIGSLLSVLVLKGIYFLMAVKFQDAIPFFPMVFEQSALARIYVFVAVIGITLGTLGAYLSVSRSLKSSE